METNEPSVKVGWTQVSMQCDAHIPCVPLQQSGQHVRMQCGCAHTPCASTTVWTACTHAVWMRTYPVCLYNSLDGMHACSVDAHIPRVPLQWSGRHARVQCGCTHTLCASTTVRMACTHAIEVRVAGIFVIISVLSMRETVHE